MKPSRQNSCRWKGISAESPPRKELVRHLCRCHAVMRSLALLQCFVCAVGVQGFAPSPYFAPSVGRICRGGAWVFAVAPGSALCLETVPLGKATPTSLHHHLFASTYHRSIGAAHVRRVFLAVGPCAQCLPGHRVGLASPGAGGRRQGSGFLIGCRDVWKSQETALAGA